MDEDSEVLKIIDAKADFSDDVAKKVTEDPQLLTVIFEGISSKTARIKFRSAKTFKIISEYEPGLLYPHWDFFVDILDNDNSILLWNALDTIANLTAVDNEHKFDEIFKKYYQFLDAESMVTAAHVIDNSAKIVLNRPDLTNVITSRLLKVSQTHRGVDCQDILSGKAILAFQNYFDLIKNKDDVLSFAENQTKSQRNATRVKAEKFLKKYKANK